MRVRTTTRTPATAGRRKAPDTTATTDSSGIVQAAVPRQEEDRSTVDRVINHVREGMRVGRYALGQRLVESDLQALLGTSRGSIREAMRRLDAEGLVEIKHHKGARVRPISIADVRAIYEIREVLEGLACRLATNNLEQRDNKQGLLTLEADFDRTFGGAPRSYFDYNDRFHSLIQRMSNNERLIRQIEQLQIPAFILLHHVIVDRDAAMLSRNEHRFIVTAMVERDAERAEACMRLHIRSNLERVLAATRDQLVQAVF